MAEEEKDGGENKPSADKSRKQLNTVYLNQVIGPEPATARARIKNVHPSYAACPPIRPAAFQRGYRCRTFGSCNCSV
jgi:hypothetical protein